MSEPNQDAFEKLLKQKLKAASSPIPNHCPDENQVAGYLEGRIPNPERERLESHFSLCSDCREQLALLLQLETTPIESLETTKPKRSSNWMITSWSWVQNLGYQPALALVVLAVVSTFIGIRVANRSLQIKETANKKVPQILAEKDFTVDRGEPATPSVPAIPSANPPPSKSPGSIDSAISTTRVKDAEMKQMPQGNPAIDFRRNEGSAAKTEALKETSATAPADSPMEARSSAVPQAVPARSSPEKEQTLSGATGGAVGGISLATSTAPPPAPAVTVNAAKPSQTLAAEELGMDRKDSKKVRQLKTSALSEDFKADSLQADKLEKGVPQSGQVENQMGAHAINSPKSKVDSAYKTIQGKRFELRGVIWTDLSLDSKGANDLKLITVDPESVSERYPVLLPFQELWQEKKGLIIQLDGKIFMINGSRSNN
jgi:hypothetical protein